MKYVLFILLMLGSTSLYADCDYNGQDYPTGTVVSGFTYQADGTWG